MVLYKAIDGEIIAFIDRLKCSKFNLNDKIPDLDKCINKINDTLAKYKWDVIIPPPKFLKSVKFNNPTYIATNSNISTITDIDHNNYHIEFQQ